MGDIFKQSEDRKTSRRSRALAGWTLAWTTSSTAWSAPRTGCSASSIRTATGAANSKRTVMLESDYIFMHTLLGTGDRGKMERAVNEILRHQNEDGGWSIYPGGPSNISYGVKAIWR